MISVIFVESEVFRYLAFFFCWWIFQFPLLSITVIKYYFRLNLLTNTHVCMLSVFVYMYSVSEFIMLWKFLRKLTGKQNECHGENTQQVFFCFLLFNFRRNFTTWLIVSETRVWDAFSVVLRNRVSVSLWHTLQPLYILELGFA